MGEGFTHTCREVEAGTCAITPSASGAGLETVRGILLCLAGSDAGRTARRAGSGRALRWLRRLLRVRLPDPAAPAGPGGAGTGAAVTAVAAGGWRAGAHAAA